MDEKTLDALISKGWDKAGYHDGISITEIALLLYRYPEEVERMKKAYLLGYGKGYSAGYEKGQREE